MKTHLDYIDDACKCLDKWSGKKFSAAPSQLQTINLALVMAVADLIEAIKEKK